MVSSWFSGGGGGGSSNSNSNNGRRPPSLSEILTCLYPPSSSQQRGVAVGGSSGSPHHHGTRFTTLLLEHGETAWQDWAVVAHSQPLSGDEVGALDATAPHLVSSSTLSSSSSSSTGHHHKKQTLWAQSPQIPRNHAHQPSQRFRSSSSLPSSPVAAAASGSSTSLSEHDESSSTTQWRSVQGRLYLCSRSLVLDPYDHSQPVVRLPLSKWMQAPYEQAASENTAQQQQQQPLCLTMEARLHLAMKRNNVIGPFESIAVPTRFQLTFLHSAPRGLTGLLEKLWLQRQSATTTTTTTTTTSSSNSRNSPLTPETYQAWQQPSTLTAGEQQLHHNVFSNDNLVDVAREQFLTTALRCHVVTPLQSQPGVLVVTTERLYFQPASGLVLTDHATTERNNASAKNRPSSSSFASTPARKATAWKPLDLVATARRYHGLRDSSLELYWKDQHASSRRGSTTTTAAAPRSTLIAFERRHDRELVLRLLPTHVPCVTDRDFLVRVARAWWDRQIGNLDYLLALNAAAGRSFHDLSRYPVVPWVLKEYESKTLNLLDPKVYRDLSKPMGALNEQRLKYFRERWQNMQEDGLHNQQAFLYGTHYSAPGYVLFYLVRSLPEHMLCLQNGKFDAPDRLFHSVANSWSCTLTNHADLKELIPEFFTEVDFLWNARGLALGATQTGERVNDVLLPAWARSARHFVKVHRQALESEHVRQHLPAWIDLIFGVNSRGPAALESYNLFHRMAYLGPRELADMPSEQERYTAELQATEFGIVPDQLFVQAHPVPTKAHPAWVGDDFIAANLGRASAPNGEAGHGREAWELLDAPEEDEEDQDDDDQDVVNDDRQALEGRDNDVFRDNSNLGHPAGTLPPPTGRPPLAAHDADKVVPLRGAGSHPSEGGAGSAFSLSSSLDTSKDHASVSSPSVSSNTTVPVSNKVAASDWDMKILERRQVHGDAVSGVVLIVEDGQPARSFLATTSLDGGLMIHKVNVHKSEEHNANSTNASAAAAAAADQNRTSAFGLSRFAYSSILSRTGTTSTSSAPSPTSSTTYRLTEYRSHSARDPLASLVLAKDGGEGCIAFAGGHDDVVLAYGVNSACAVASVYSHRDAVTGLDLLAAESATGALNSALWLENSTHIMISGSWDATVKVWSASVSPGETVAIHREPLAELFDADASIVSVSAAHGIGGILIAAGCSDGSFLVWNLHSDGVQVLLHKEAPRGRGTGPCSAVQWFTAPNKDIFLWTAFATGKVASYLVKDNGRDSLQPVTAVSLGVCILSLRHVPEKQMLLAGCADGGLRLLRCDDGARFSGKPTLWKAVHHKNAPGICSISVCLSSSSHCFAATGGEDGTLALFELTQVAHKSPQAPRY